MSHESLDAVLLLKKLCNSSVCAYMNVYYQKGVRDRERRDTQGTKGPGGEGWTKPWQRCVRMCDGGIACARVYNFSCSWFGGIIWTELGLSWGQMSRGHLYLPGLHAVSCVATEQKRHSDYDWFTSNGHFEAFLHWFRSLSYVVLIEQAFLAGRNQYEAHSVIL